MSTSWGALCVMMRMWLLTVTSMLHREVSALMCVLQRKASRCLARRCGARYLMVCCERTSCSCFTITYICSLACFSNAMPSDMTHHAARDQLRPQRRLAHHRGPRSTCPFSADLVERNNDMRAWYALRSAPGSQAKPMDPLSWRMTPVEIRHIRSHLRHRQPPRPRHPSRWLGSRRRCRPSPRLMLFPIGILHDPRGRVRC
jgi:hypothetical protein